MPQIKKAKIKFKPTAGLVAGVLGVIVVSVLVYRATGTKK